MLPKCFSTTMIIIILACSSNSPTKGLCYAYKGTTPKKKKKKEMKNEKRLLL